MMVQIYNLVRDDSSGQMVYPVRGVRFGWQGAREGRLAADIVGTHGADAVTIGWGESWKEEIPLEPKVTLYQRIAEVVTKLFPDIERDITVVLYET